MANYKLTSKVNHPLSISAAHASLRLSLDPLGTKTKELTSEAVSYLKKYFPGIEVTKVADAPVKAKAPAKVAPISNTVKVTKEGGIKDTEEVDDVDPNADGGDVDPNADGGDVDPNADGGDVDPNADGGDVDPNAEANDVDPNAEADDVDPNAEEEEAPIEFSLDQVGGKSTELLAPDAIKALDTIAENDITLIDAFVEGDKRVTITEKVQSLKATE
ncbi:hypothetical protein M1M30_gp072 [Maribacter phage Colly_1]|uniref:Uncharacterized protein n=1 Tax=Maribacter phage Colly_1 TaxID=2745691 RepID=A0A8E4UY29_9CAUD|nr:hypothetical protein M1M30_gp072 [Maribacter phage Colly_1]QQO97358.1 hypothetical protein Colly1_72 [Maribacter phage Colly_1]